MIYPNILGVIGRTPTVKINRLSSDLCCELYAKCEFLNPGGSFKDRVGYYMVKHAQARREIKPGDTLIEPSSGNTGIGIALAGIVMGYKVIVTMPAKISYEKQMVLERLGVTVYRTRPDAVLGEPDHYISLAKQLQNEIPDSYVLNQYSNPDNPNAHYYGTAQEIVEDFGSNLDMIVVGVGTGGLINGVARRLKEENPCIQIIGVDPIGSILSGDHEAKPYHVEGIGHDFFPEVLDRSLIDSYIKTTDKDSFYMARQLMIKEGLLVGGSSGAVVWAALKAAKKLKKNQKCLVILPDSIRNYMSKFVSDAWMKENGLQ